MTIILNKRLPLVQEWLVISLITLLSRSSMFFSSNMSLDDYNSSAYGGSVMYMNLADKRFFLQILVWLFEYLGYRFPFLGSAGYVMFSFSSAAFMLMIRHYWFKNLPSVPTIACALLFTTFPYFTDLLSYHCVSPTMSVMLLAGGLFLVAFGSSKKATVLSTALLLFGISYQPFVGIYVIAILVALLLGAHNAATNRIHPNEFTQNAYPHLLRFCALLVTIAIYFVASSVVNIVTGIPANNRTQFAAFWDIPEKSVIFLKQFQYHIFRGEVCIPWSVKIIQMVLLGFLAFGILKTTFQKWKPLSRSIPFFLLALFLFLLMCLSTMGILLVLKDSSGNMRSLIAFSMFWPGVFACAWSFNQGLAKNIVGSTGVVLAFSYFLLCNNQAVDFARLNNRDRLVANRIMERLSYETQYPSMQTVVFVGADHNFNTRGIHTSTQGFNFSALYWFSNTAVLSEVSGTKLRPPTLEEQEKGRVLSKSKPVWPLEGSVFIDGEIGIVVLGLP